MISRRIRRHFARRMAALAAADRRAPGETRQMARFREREARFYRWSHRFRKTR